MELEVETLRKQQMECKYSRASEILIMLSITNMLNCILNNTSAV